MVDGRSGITAADEHVASLARGHAKKTWLAVNKAEGLEATTADVAVSFASNNAEVAGTQNDIVYDPAKRKPPLDSRN